MSGSRRLVAVLLVVLSVTNAGCLGVLLGTDSLEFAAADATVDASALEETGYGEYRDESINQTRTFSVAGQNRTAVISNELHAYNRTGTLGSVGETELGRIVVLSTPAVEIADRTLNPVGAMSNLATVRRLAPSDAPGDSLAFRENRSVRALGARRTVSEFGATSQVDGTAVNSSVHVSVFEHGSDFVVVVAVHPDRGGEEQADVDALLAALRHPAGD